MEDGAAAGARLIGLRKYITRDDTPFLPILQGMTLQLQGITLPSLLIRPNTALAAVLRAARDRRLRTLLKRHKREDGMVPIMGHRASIHLDDRRTGFVR